MVKIKPRAVVTGGAGFIGSHLTDHLIKNNYNVIVVDDLSNGNIENVNPKAVFFQINVKSNDFFKILKDSSPDIIFHFAAQSSLSKSLKDPKIDIDQNLSVVVDVLKYSQKAKVKKFIFASSAAIYGEAEKPPISEDAMKNPNSPYGIAKHASEFFIKYFSQLHGLSYTNLRFSNIYGERQNTSAEGGVVGKFIHKIINKLPAEIYNHGTQTRDFIHVSDVVNATFIAANKNLKGDFNISTGKQTSINELFNLISKISDLECKSVYINKQRFEVKNNALLFKKFKSKTGWMPKMNLENGLKATYQYFAKK